MNIWAVIPTKPFDQGKSRLAAILGPADRQTLNQSFYEHTLTVLLEVFPPARLVTVSKSTEALAIAEEHGARALKEPESSDLNAALTMASRFARDAGAEGVLSVSCDLPLLAADDLEAMLCNATRLGITIAGDKARIGTNAMLVAPAGLIVYRFGGESFAAHSNAADLAGGTAVTVSRLGLAFDVDTPMDLESWRTNSDSLID